MMYFAAYYIACMFCVYPVVRSRMPRNLIEGLVLLMFSPVLLLLDTMRNRPGAVAAVVLIALTVILTGCDEADEAEAQSRRYCKMVGLWEQSEGQHGWPPFRGKTECADKAAP